MEHACSKCGVTVEDGVAFCPGCGAPQIRVSGLVSPAAAPSFSPENIQDGQSAPSFPAAGYPSPAATRIRWPEALRSAALGGLLLLIAPIVPVAWPLLLMLAAGGLSAVLYAKRSQVRLTGGLGARLGAAGGLLGWAMLLVLLLAELSIGGGQFLSTLRQMVEEQLAKNPDPVLAKQVIATLNTPAGMAAFLFVCVLLFLIIAVLCGAIGGSLGALLVRPSQRKDGRK